MYSYLISSWLNFEMAEVKERVKIRGALPTESHRIRLLAILYIRLWKKKRLWAKKLPYDEHIRYTLVPLSHTRWQHLHCMFTSEVPAIASHFWLLSHQTRMSAALLRFYIQFSGYWWCWSLYFFNFKLKFVQ